MKIFHLNLSKNRFFFNRNLTMIRSSKMIRRIYESLCQDTQILSPTHFTYLPKDLCSTFAFSSFTRINEKIKDYSFLL